MIGQFTKTEIATILRGLSRSTPGGNYSREAYEAVMGWATAAKLDGDILELVLQGFADPYVDHEGILRFAPTEAGLSSSRRYELERMQV